MTPLLALKALAPSLMALGSIILAIRFKSVVDALVLALAATAANDSNAHIHVKRCQRFGTGLLVAGFLLIAAGAILSGFIAYMTAG